MLFEIAKKSDIDQIEECGKSNLLTFYKKDMLLDIIDDKDHVIMKVTNKNKLIGFIILKIDQEKNNVHIKSIAVYSEYRNQQIGSKMIHLVKNLFPNNNITLYVQTTNKDAIRFYKKNDFIIMNKKKDYYNNLHNNDAYTMIYLM